MARHANFLNLFPQISEAFRRYGISDSTTSLIVAEICTVSSHHDKIKAIIDGTASPFSQLSEITDWATIKKVCYICQVPSPTSHRWNSTIN